MTVRQTAYNTTATGKLQIKELLDELNANNNWFDNPLENIYSLQGRSSYETTAAAFVFPIVDLDSSNKTTYIDARSLVSYDPIKDSVRIKQIDQYDALLLQAQLSNTWALGQINSIEFMSNLPISVFMTWVAESIGKRMIMRGDVQYMVTILAAIMYYNNFRDTNMSEDQSMSDSFMQLVTQSLGYRTSDVNSMLIKEYGWVSSVDDFCKACYEATQSVSLKNLNPSLLFTLIGGSMWGANAAEKLAVALEYPPVWITLLFQVIVDRSYRGKCSLSNIAERRSFVREHARFVNNCLARIQK